MVLYNDTTDATSTFVLYRLQQSGPALSSNMYLIDSGIAADRARLTTLEALKFIIPVSATFVSGSTYISSPSGIASYVDGTVILLNLDTTSSGVVQLNLNSLGLRSLVKYNSTGTATVNLDASDLIKSRLYFFKYDLSSTTWIWIAATSGDQIQVTGSATGNLVSMSSTGSLLGTLTQSLMISQTIHAATAKTTPVDADEIVIVDSAASNVTKKVTWANLKATVVTSLGAMIASAANKTTPVAADLLGIADSASSNATKNITLTQLFAQFGLLSHAFTAKTTIVGADETTINDSVASFAGKRITWANVAASWGVLIDGLTGKTTIVAADEFPLADSAASFVTKKVTLTNLSTSLGTLFGAVIDALTAKTTPLAADELVLADTASSNATKKMSITNLFSIFGTLLDAYTGKTTPVGADEFAIADSAASFSVKKLSLTNLVAALKTLIATDTLAAPTDITTNNATSSAHGLLQKLSGAIADVHRGDGTYGGIYAPEGFLQNGVITVTVASNNITVAIKTLAAANPSASDPVYVRINNNIRSITAALSVTKNAGTNWFNSGASELATKEIDYFVYLGYNATDGVVIGFARIPYARQYSDFSVTTTNEKYCAISTITTAASTDYYEVIGRFAATLSATASFNWSVPTFTAINLINTPIYDTRLLTYAPTLTGYSVAPATSVYTYRVRRESYTLKFAEGSGTSNATTKTYTTPFAAKTLTNMQWTGTFTPLDNGANKTIGFGLIASGASLINMYLSTFGAWTASGSACTNEFNMEVDMI